MKKYNFLLTPVSGTNTGTMIFDALAELNIYQKIVVTDINDFSYAKHLGCTFYKQPYASSDEYIDSILSIVEEEGINVIIPGSDWELKKISENRKKFEERGVALLINSPEVLNLCFNKNYTCDFLKENNFPFPKTIPIRNLRKTPPDDCLRKILETINYPFIIKPNNITGGSALISIIQDKEDFIAFYRRDNELDVEFLAQEYIDAPDFEFTVGVMSDLKGEIISSFALKRDLTASATRKICVKKKGHEGRNPFIIVSGGLTQGYSGDFPEIRTFAESVAKALGSVGPINIQCRQTENGIYIFEINPRFSASTNIRSALGHNDVDIIFRSIILHENIGQQQYRFCSVVRGQKILYHEKG